MRTPGYGWFGLLALLFLLVESGTSLASENRLAAIAAQANGDPRVQAARSMYQSKLAEVGGAQSAYLPVLRGTGSVGNVSNQDPLLRQGDKRTYGLQLEQPIPVFGHESTRVDLAVAAARIEEAEFQRVVQMVTAELVEANMAVYATKEALDLRERLAENMQAQLQAIRESVAGGRLRATEEWAARSRAAQAEARRLRTAVDLRSAQARLMRLMPGAVPARLESKELRSWWSGEVSIEAFKAAADRAAPLVLKAQAEVAQAAADYAMSKADYWPKMSVIVHAERGSFGGAKADSQSIMLGFSVPLYEGGASVSRADSAARRLDAARERARAERLQTIERVAEAWVRWQAAEPMATAWRESELQEEQVIRLVEQQLAQGASTRLDVLRARQTWLETLVQGVEHRLQGDLAWLRLVQETGALAVGPESGGRSP